MKTMVESMEEISENSNSIGAIIKILVEKLSTPKQMYKKVDVWALKTSFGVVF